MWFTKSQFQNQLGKKIPVEQQNNVKIVFVRFA